MARRTTKTTSTRTRTASRRPAARPAARATTTTTDVEVVEEDAGAGWETGVAVMTFVALLVAILLVDMHLADYGAGMFF